MGVVCIRVLIQILCSYVTLPLYALVTQMGSNMKPTIFNERVATALRNWHHTAKKNIKHTKGSGPATPMSSRPGTPLHGQMSPVHLLRDQHRSDANANGSPGTPGRFRAQQWDDGSSNGNGHQASRELGLVKYDPEAAASRLAPIPAPRRSTTDHEIRIVDNSDFSFEKKVNG